MFCKLERLETENLVISITTASGMLFSISLFYGGGGLESVLTHYLALDFLKTVQNSF